MDTGGAIRDSLDSNGEIPVAITSVQGRIGALPDGSTSVQDHVGALPDGSTSVRDHVGALPDGSTSVRVALAIGMFFNVGRLMEKHAAEPWKIEDYFELALLRAGGGGSSVPPALTIEGDVDDIVLRNAAGEAVARGARDQTLPNPDP